jgi:hypothetical protein
MYDLPDDTSLTQKIVACSVLPITEILIIEYQKVDSIFLHIAFRSKKHIKLNQ